MISWKLGVGLVFLVLMMGFVVTGEEGCCALNVNEEKCATVDESECQSDAVFAVGSDCLSTSFCQKGCCYDEDLGIYDSDTLRSDCSRIWDSDSTCNLPGATNGCCVLGERAIWSTSGQCEAESLFNGISEVDWRTNIDRAQCSFIGNEARMGACVAGGVCRVLSEEGCYDARGVFSEGYLCTSSSLNTGCEMTEETICKEGKDEVYFLDSCGNVGNIYDASRINDVTYWDRIIDVDDSCGSDSGDGNAGSEDCGNCDRFEGGYCESAFSDNFDVDYGNYYCKEMSCLFDGDRYENGESWCIYDGVSGNNENEELVVPFSYEGNSLLSEIMADLVLVEPTIVNTAYGRDVVGSRHWRYVCSQGVVQIEPCADYRNEVCAQSNTLGNGSDEIVFRRSVCQKNDWRSCIDYNFEDDWRELCEENDACFVNGYASSGVSKSVCAAKVPGGFDFEDEGGDNEMVCDLGNAGCLVRYEKSLASYDWKIVSGGECLTESFTMIANDLCASLGDCGAYVNIDGKVTTRGYGIRGGGRGLGGEYLEGLKDFAVPVEVDGFRSGALTNVALLSLLFTSDALTNVTNVANVALLSSNHGMPASHNVMKVFTIIAVGWHTFVLDDLWGIDLKKKKTVSFDCEPWVQPRGGDNCDVCNEDPLKPCSKYRCESLGGACELVNIGSATEYCADLSPSNSAAPVIAPLGSVALNSRYAGESSDGFRIEGEDGVCLDAYTPLNFGIKTDVLADCRFDIEPIEFENMSRDFDGARYLYEHSMTFVLPDPTHGQSLGSNWTGDLSLYVKCQDVHGHETLDFYEVEMCVNAGPDETAPMIRAVDPANNKMVSFDVSLVNVSVVTNEVAECKWDILNTDYSLMANSMVCEDSLGYPSTNVGYKCSGVFPVSNSSNDYYIRCADQPWLDDGEGNANVESFVYTIRRPSEKISIEKIAPAADFEVSSAISEIDLRVQTANGGDVHICSYSFSGYDRVIEMFETGEGDFHKQPSLNVAAGKKTIYVECEDESGDSVREITEFDIIHDTSTPQVARIWQAGGSLHIVTTESAECQYTTTSCEFNWGDGELAGNGESHVISVVQGETYYVKCEDEFGNVPDGCSITVRAL